MGVPFITDKILRKFVKRFLFVFNDVLLVTNKKDGVEQYDVMQVSSSNLLCVFLSCNGVSD
jgi:hypothetical protein